MARWLSSLFLLGVGCRCPQSPPPRVVHFAGWHALTAAVVLDDGAEVRRLARSLVDAGAGEEAHAIGAAAGFLQVAADPAERIEGLVEAAAACGGCHGGVRAPAMAAWTHEEGAAGVLRPVLWPDADAPAPTDEAHPAVVAAFGSSAAPDERAVAVLQACVDCHVSLRTQRSQ